MSTDSTQTHRGDIRDLRAVMEGPVRVPGDDGYDEARKVWNADVDRTPAAIVECMSAADVAVALKFARAAGLEVAVRGGGHSVPGLSSCDGGLVIDLRRLNGVTVDAEARVARVQGGALMADVDAATQANGLALPMGLISHTGIGGLTLGGGMGWLTRHGGLSIDNMTAAEVVVADGRILRAAEDENPDLFWALRGGGGNFGVVTEFEFRLHEVGPMVQFGLFFWDEDHGAEALRLMRHVIADLPRSLTAFPAAGLTSPPAPFVPVEHHHKLGYALLLIGFGDAAEHHQVADRIREALPPLFDVVTPMPFVALQQMFDAENAWGVYAYEKGGYIEDLSDDVIEVITKHAPRKMSAASVVLFYRLDGAYSGVSDVDTAFSGGRSPRYFANFLGVTPSPDALVTEREWVRSFERALRPLMMTDGTYVNALDDGNADRTRDGYGGKYERLVAVKAAYDPENVFHRNINILPPDIPIPRT